MKFLIWFLTVFLFGLLFLTPANLTRAQAEKARHDPEQYYEQPLTRDEKNLWRFPRGYRPLSVSLRVYADGLRLVQGYGYHYGSDDAGPYLRMDTAPVPQVVIADFNE